MHIQSLVERTLGRRRPVPRGLQSPPLLSGGLPLVGHTVEFVTHTIDLLRRAQRELGEVAAIQVATRRMVALFGPEANEAVFRAPDSDLNPAEAYKIMTPVFGKDMVYDATPDKMAEQLKFLLPALKDRRMRTYGDTIVREVEDSIASWGQSGTIDLVDYCRVLTNYTSSHCLIGREFRERMTEEFASVYHDLERGVTPIAYINAHLPLPSFRKRDRARVRMVEMIGKIIDERRREGREGEDFLQTLMESRYSDGRTLTEHEITGMLLASMFAGHHTSSVTTAWTLAEMLRTPAYLKRAVDQIDALFGGGQPVTFQSLRELTVVENAVKEALRLHPPLFMLVRVAKKDWTFKNYFFPAGTWLLVSPTVSHLLPECFAEPERFDPDRFAPPREEDKRDFAYIPFGGGRHKCLGNAFAILQVKTILAILLGRYEFELVGDEVASDFHGLVIGPKEPLRLRYRRRAQPSVTVAPPVTATTASGAAPAASGCPFHATAPVEPPAAQSATAAAGCPFHAAPAEAAPPVAAAPEKKLRVVLDLDFCQGHAACVGEAPEVFQIGAGGKVELVMAEPPPALYPKVRAAAQFCPTRTIRIQED